MMLEPSVFEKNYESFASNAVFTETGVLPGTNVLTPPVTQFFIQVVIIIGFCELLSLIGHYLKQPRVVFEILAGILLGPSAFGLIAGFTENIFPEDSLEIIEVVANTGLSLYLFVVGLEVDIKVLITNALTTSFIAFSSIALPFVLGVGVSRLMYDELEAANRAKVSFSSYFIFVGTSFAITAFPVLARIIKDSSLMHTFAGRVALNAAALNDAIAWVLLVIAISFSKPNNNALSPLWLVLSMLGYAVFLFTVFRWLFAWFVSAVETVFATQIKAKMHLFVITIVLLFSSAWFTSMLGVDPIVGAFMFGIVIPRQSKLYAFCILHMEDFIATFFLPIYFVFSGLRTDFTTLKAYPDVLILLLVCLVATAGKILGAGIPCLISRFSWRESCVIAILMNTRGLIELIVLNIGVNAGILGQRTFSILVVMCLFTTFMTFPLVRCIYYDVMRSAKRAKDGDVLPPSTAGSGAADEHDRDGGNGGGGDLEMNNHNHHHHEASVLADDDTSVAAAAPVGAEETKSYYLPPTTIVEREGEEENDFARRSEYMLETL